VQSGSVLVAADIAFVTVVCVRRLPAGTRMSQTLLSDPSLFCARLAVHVALVLVVNLLNLSGLPSGLVAMADSVSDVLIAALHAKSSFRDPPRLAACSPCCSGVNEPTFID
jgi:hypothetical protein